MRLATGDQITEQLAQSTARDQSMAPHQQHHENEARSFSESHPSQSQDYLSLLAGATNDAVRDLDLKTGRLSWPQGLQTLLGYEPSEARNEVAFWQNQIHPEDRARTAGTIRAALNGPNHHWSGEYRFRHADGSYVHLLERALIIRDHDGAAMRLVGSLMDITARKQLQDQLCRSQKMEAFGQLAGGVAHDFNNFLTTILGYSDLLLEERPIKGALAEHVGEIRAAAARASALTQQLLAFSRKQPLEPVIVEVNSIITNLERSLLRLIGENISVVCHLHHEKEGAHIKADPSQITQIILNLAVNARDAMPKGGQLTLETAIVDLTNEMESPFLCGDLVSGHYVLIKIADNGIGMSEEVKAHLFEPFFTTKTDQERSGLGLATCYDIVHQSGGHLRVESDLGKGTVVQIYIPRVPAPPPPSYKKPNNKKPRGGTETILVLEDDISVRHISVRTLRGFGYQVMEAANGADARRLVSENRGQKIDLLLTDLIMPEMSGRRFADSLQI